MSDNGRGTLPPPSEPLATVARQRGTPRLVFYTELAVAPLRALLEQPVVLALIQHHGATVAMALRDMGPERAELVRWLRQHQVAVIAWLQADADGQRFNLQNYPQAARRYQWFRAWVQQHDLVFSGVGLDTRLPAGELGRLYDQGSTGILRRIWLAREDALYPAAQVAYRELLAEMRMHGYETHLFQLPPLIDDRVAGTTLVQRALGVADVAADVEVLLCYSLLPVRPNAVDTGGALLVAYGSYADAIAVGGAGATDYPAELLWATLQRDLLLAARYTDTIYVFSLEACAAEGLLERLAVLDWRRQAQPEGPGRAVLLTLRSLLVSYLLLVRVAPALFGWAGWLVALGLLIARLRRPR